MWLMPTSQEKELAGYSRFGFMERYFEYGYYHQQFMVGEYVGIENWGNLVSVNGETGLKSVDYTSLLCLKIKAMEDKLEKMERELQELKNR